MSDLINTVTPYATINGKPLPVDSFEATMGAYGSVGRFSFTTAISVLASYEFDAQNLLSAYVETAQPSMADGSPSLPVGIFTNGAYGQAGQQIFGGDLDDMTWDFDEDKLTVQGRDFSGRLKDYKIVLDQGWVNLTPTQFAGRVAGKLNLTLEMPVSPPAQQTLGVMMQYAGESSPSEQFLLGTQQSSQIWSDPKDSWDLLNFLARAIGWTVYTTVDQKLYFGPAMQQPPRIFTWRADANATATPVRKLRVLHQPHRYGSFKVVVMSYHNLNVQTYSSTILGLAAPLKFTNGKVVGQGVWKNADVLASAVEEGKPNYFYYVQGLTPPQVQQLSLAIGFDLAKRLYIVSGEIDGDPTVIPMQAIQLEDISGEGLQGYEAKPLMLASVEHTFDMTDGYLTRWKAWYAPSAPQDARSLVPSLPASATVKSVGINIGQ